MNIRVYLIDDDKKSKFPQLVDFVDFLNKVFQHDGITFTAGRMRMGGKEAALSTFFATDKQQIDEVLKDDGVLILLDVIMGKSGNISAAGALMEMHSDVNARKIEIENILSAGQSSKSYQLAATVMAIAEKTFARIALVSTGSSIKHIGRLRALGKVFVSWDPEYWHANSSLITELKELIEPPYMNGVVELRKIWKEMARASKMTQWTLGNNSAQMLFPEHSNYHNISVCLNGHLACSKSMATNNAALKTATDNFSTIANVTLKSPAECIAILKASSRARQMPLFFAQRILGLQETEDVSKALSWDNSHGRDSAAVIYGLKIINAAKRPNTAFKFITNTGVADLIIELSLTDTELSSVEIALNSGAARRSVEPDRNGKPGQLTFGVGLLAPDERRNESQSNKNTLLIIKHFNIEDL